MEIFKGKVVCPRCDGNGLIFKARIEIHNHTYIYVMNVMRHGKMQKQLNYQTS